MIRKLCACVAMLVGVLSLRGNDVCWEYRDGIISGVEGPLCGELRIPSEINGEKVVAIGKRAFMKKEISKVVIGDGIQRIETEAFVSCRQLEKVELGKGLVILDDNAFMHCESLKEVVCSDELEKVGKRAFSGCRMLQKITLPKGLNEIGERAFCGCEGLRSVSIPASVSRIENGSFQGCKSLSEVDLSEGVIYIGECAFWGCKGLKEVLIPTSVKEVGKNAFDKNTIRKGEFFKQEEHEKSFYLRSFLGVNFTGHEVSNENFDRKAIEGKTPGVLRDMWFELRKPFRYIDSLQITGVSKLNNIEECIFCGVIDRPVDKDSLAECEEYISKINAKMKRKLSAREIEGIKKRRVRYSMSDGAYDKLCMEEAKAVARILVKKYGISFSWEGCYYLFENENQVVSIWPQRRDSEKMVIKFENKKIRRDDSDEFERMKKEKDEKDAASSKKFSADAGADLL